MKTKYIEFLEVTIPSRKTTTWNVQTIRGKDVIGIIQWYPPWRQYCFFPSDDTIYSAQCLEDIMRFLMEETAEYRHKKKVLTCPQGPRSYV